MSKDYYKILGVEKNASKDEIKKAFKKKAMEFHPDRPTGNEEKFKEVNEAFQVLGDEQKRQRYDQFGSDFEQQGGFGGGAGWEDFMNAARGGGFGGNFGGVDLGDIFGDLFGFGGGRRNGRQERGKDIQIDLEIDFKEAAFGTEKQVNLRKQSTCEVCHGSGGEPGAKKTTCSTCHGQGQVKQVQRTVLGAIQTVSTCPHCHGRGEMPEKKCKHCGGDGILAKTENIKIKIPAGIDNGQSIRLPGHGEAARYGGTSGDLYVRIHVKSSKDFQRDGADVYSEKSISYPQAVLGDKVEVETLEGEVKIVVPPGTEHGQLIRLKGKGANHLARQTRGDQYVKIKIEVPKKVSRKIKKLLEELAKEF